MPGDDDERLTDALLRLALALLHDATLKADLERLTRVTCRVIANCSGASVSMLVEGEPTTVAVTDRVSLELDVAQYEGGDGPCITALGGDVVRIGYIPGDDRFPHFARGAADRRVLSVLSTPAIDHGTVVGSLNVYSHEADAFDDQDGTTALIMAAEVAQALVKSSVLSSARSIRQQLQEAHDEASLVAQAQGVVMAMQDCSATQAQELIRNAAHSNAEPIISTAERILSSLDQLDDAAPRQDR
jgi:GAF domain-containing protein